MRTPITKLIDKLIDAETVAEQLELIEQVKGAADAEAEILRRLLGELDEMEKISCKK